MKRRSNNRRRTGFTLLEVLLVMTIIVVMASMVGFGLLQYYKGAQEDAAYAQISVLKQASIKYKFDMGRFPTQLDDLYTAPAGATSNRWRGPYIDDPVPADPWGNQYNYTPDDTNEIVQITSAGPDGQMGTQDDVSTNKKPK